MTCTRQKKNQDRLISLPPEILSHILSLMPTKSAVKTSILSKKWRYRWTLVHKLDFDDFRPVHGKDCLLEFVDRAIRLSKTSKLELFKVNISKWTLPKSTLSAWISEAIKLNVCELDIQVRKLELPLSRFTCKTLTRFRLHFSQPGNLRYNAEWVCPSLVTLPCLKTLDIVVHSNPFDSAFKLIRGCPVLENLSLEIRRRESAGDYCFQIPTLKRLSLTIRSFMEDNVLVRSVINKVILNVPNLEYLFFLEYCLDNHLLVEFLKGMRGAKYLSSMHLVGYVRYPLSSLNLPEFANVKRLELMGFSGSSGLLLLFLQHCPQLEDLCITKTGFRDEESPPVPSCMATNLKTVKVTNIMGDVRDINFMKFMLAHSKVLKTFTVTFYNQVPLNTEGEFSRKVSMLPRASADCQIHLVGKWPHSTTPWYF